MANKIILAQMKQRRDTKANWAAQNPVLLAGELGIVSDDPNLYKVGDGATAWNALPFRGFNGTVSQTTGTSANAVMSQKAVTEIFTQLSRSVNQCYMAGSVVRFSKSERKITITGGTCMGAGNQTSVGTIEIPQDTSYSSHYIIINTKTLSYRLATPNVPLSLNENEGLFAAIRWTEGFYFVNAISVYIDDAQIDLTYLATQQKNLATELTATKNKIGLEAITWTLNVYEQVPIVQQGQQGRIVLNGITTNRKITFFAKTQTSDSTYQSLGAINAGEELIFVADRDIQYIKAYNDYSDVYPLSITLQTAEGLAYKVDLVDKEAQKASVLPKMYNPGIDWHKETFNVLDIGNSYTGDCHTYLAGIIDATGVETKVNLYKAVRSSGSFKTWVDCYNNKDNSTYSVSRTYGESLGIDATGAANNGEVFRNALAKNWDVIIIHQVSNFSTEFDTWETQTEKGYLKEFIQVLRKTNPQASIGFLMTHSYRGDYPQNTEKDSLLRFEKIAEATKRFAREYGVNFIIPYGTAVQNLRASSLNDTYEFSEDGTHLGAGLGDYVAGCCYYQAMIAPRNGVSIEGNTFRITNLDESIGGRKNVTNETAPIAQNAAIMACCDMWNVIRPDL